MAIIVPTTLTIDGPHPAAAVLRTYFGDPQPVQCQFESDRGHVNRMLITYLAEVGPNRVLADEPCPLDPTWPAWVLDTQLRTVAGIGATIWWFLCF